MDEIIKKEIIHKLSNNINLSNNDINLIYNLINNKFNDSNSLIEIEKEKKKINNIVNIISIIQKIILLISILIYIYLIYNLFINKTETNINKHLFYLKMLSYLILFTYIISLKNTIIAIKNYLVNHFDGFSSLMYIMIFKQILVFILNKHELIIKLTKDYRYIIVVVILIIACILYNIYNSTKHRKSNNPIAKIELSSYIFNKYGSKLNTDFIKKTLDNNLNNINLNKDLNKDLNKYFNNLI